MSVRYQRPNSTPGGPNEHNQIHSAINNLHSDVQDAENWENVNVKLLTYEPVMAILALDLCDSFHPTVPS